VSAEAATERSCSIVELRRYALRPGGRETLIELFERELMEPQEELGMRVLAQFRDLDDPDSFVWMRGFEDMATRLRGLESFYGGPVWARHRQAAVATMLDSDNVLLLRPTFPAPTLDAGDGPSPVDGGSTSGMLAVTICPLERGHAAEFPDFFARELEPALRDAGADVIAGLATDHSPNDFPDLPVREGEENFVWISRFADEAAHASHADRLDLDTRLRARLAEPSSTWRLTPTSRSLLRA
jgi:hypothetical protein